MMERRKLEVVAGAMQARAWRLFVPARESIVSSSAGTLPSSTYRTLFRGEILQARWEILRLAIYCTRSPNRIRKLYGTRSDAQFSRRDRKAFRQPN